MTQDRKTKQNKNNEFLLKVQRILNKPSSPNQHACVYLSTPPLTANNVQENELCAAYLPGHYHFLLRLKAKTGESKLKASHMCAHVRGLCEAFRCVFED
jgi:hypothetical protein